MKFTSALVASAIPFVAAGDYDKNYGYGEHDTTLTTYTTVTICPVTSTYYEHGTTYCKTELTTSTVTVTECYGCGNQVTTVPGPIVTGGVTTEVEVTYTTVCPVTSTVYGPTETYLTTYTATSTVVAVVPTTVIEHVPGQTVTAAVTEGVEVTYTTLCPVTSTVYGPTETYLTTYTETSTVVTVVPTTVLEHIPGQTVTATKTAEIDVTYTTVVPTTETIVGPTETYVTEHTVTNTVVTKVQTTIYETVHGPVVTQTAVDVEHLTITNVYPVTEVTTIGGVEQTITYTTTSLVEVDVPTTILATVTAPGNTATEVAVHYETNTQVHAVTQVITVGGEQVTQTIESTSTAVVPVPTTIVQTLTTPVSPPPVNTPPPAVTPPVETPPVVPPSAAYANGAPSIAIVAMLVGALVMF